MAVNQEIKELIERIKFEYRLNQGEIAEKIGVTKTYLSDVINGRSPANDSLFDKIRTTFTSLPERKSECQSEQKHITMKEHRMFGSELPMTSLPLIPIDGIAGFPGSDNAPVTLPQCERYAVPEFNAKGADYLIRVSGSSMTPTYMNGDLLACRKINEITFFQWGNVYVIDTNQGVLVKRLFEDKEDPEMVICRSDNFESFPEFRLDKTGIRSLSIVVGLIRME